MHKLIIGMTCLAAGMNLAGSKQRISKINAGPAPFHAQEAIIVTQGQTENQRISHDYKRLKSDVLNLRLQADVECINNNYLKWVKTEVDRHSDDSDVTDFADFRYSSKLRSRNVDIDLAVPLQNGRFGLGTDPVVLDPVQICKNKASGKGRTRAEDFQVMANLRVNIRAACQWNAARKTNYQGERNLTYLAKVPVVCKGHTSHKTPQENSKNRDTPPVDIISFAKVRQDEKASPARDTQPPRMTGTAKSAAMAPVSDLYPNTGGIDPDDGTSFVLLIGNQGTAKAAATQVRFFMKMTGQQSLQADYLIPEMPAGGFYELHIPSVIPLDWIETAYARIDQPSFVNELDEKNNGFSFIAQDKDKRSAEHDSTYTLEQGRLVGYQRPAAVTLIDASSGLATGKRRHAPLTATNPTGD